MGPYWLKDEAEGPYEIAKIAKIAGLPQQAKVGLAGGPELPKLKTPRIADIARHRGDRESQTLPLRHRDTE